MDYQVSAAELVPKIDELVLLSVYVEVLIGDITYILYTDVKPMSDKKEIHYIIKYDMLKCYRVSVEKSVKQYVAINLVDEKIDIVQLKEFVRDQKYSLYEEYTSTKSRGNTSVDSRYLALIDDNDVKNWYNVTYSDLSIDGYKFEFENILPEKYSKSTSSPTSSSNIIDKTVSGVSEISEKYKDLCQNKGYKVDRTNKSASSVGGNKSQLRTSTSKSAASNGEESCTIFNFRVPLLRDAFIKSLIKYFGTLSFTKLSECVELKVLINEKTTADYVYEKRISLDPYGKKTDLIRHEVVQLYNTSLDSGKVNIARVSTKSDDVKLVSSNSISAIISAEFSIPLQPFGSDNKSTTGRSGGKSGVAGAGAEVGCNKEGWTLKLIANNILREYDATAIMESKNLFVKGNSLADWLATATLFHIEFETREYTKSFGADLSHIINFVDIKTFYKQVLAQLCVLFGKPKEYGITIKRLTPQPKGLDRLKFNDLYPTTGMMITPKADGNHMIYYAYGNNAYILEENVLVIQLPTFQNHVDLFEGEIIHSKHLGEAEVGADTKSALILLFDVMIIGGESMFERTTKERIARLADATKKMTSIVETTRAIISGGSDGQSRRRIVTDEDAAPMIKLRMETKPFVEVAAENPRASYESIYLAEYPYNIDGIMIISSDTKYSETKPYKWKDNNTIDFLVRECPAEMLGRFPNIKQNGKVLYHLYVGVNRALFGNLRLKRAPMYSTLFPSFDMSTVSYFPTLFSTPDMPLAYIYYGPPGLDGNIVEFSRKKFIATSIKEAEDISIVDTKEDTDDDSGDKDVANDKVDALIKSIAAVDSVETIESLKQVINSDSMYWEVARVRTDRRDDYLSGGYFGNYYDNAISNWNATHNPLAFEDLYSYEEKQRGVYFRATKSDRYVTLTNYHSMLKTIILEKYVRGAEWVMDVGIGKGQDLFRYAELDVKNLTGVDTDLMALDTLVDRYMKPPRTNNTRDGNKGEKGERERDSRGTKMPHLTVINSSIVNYSKMSAGLAVVKQDYYLKGLKSLDACVFNFSVHYCVDSFGEFIKFLSNCLHKQVGCIIITALDGRAVFDRLAEKKVARGESYEIKDVDATSGESYIKYRITRQYTENALRMSGQKIGVLLPFSVGEMYTESLVNFDYIDTCVKKIGLSVASSSGFVWNTFSEELGVSSKDRSSAERNVVNLTAADLEWVSLHSFRVYTK